MYRMDKSGWRLIRNMVYLALAVVIVAAALHASAERASACSCVPPRPPLEALARADAVFSGEGVSMEGPRGWWASSADPITVEFRVNAVWKGEIYETMFIRTAWSSASCGFEFVLDEQYLVYAHEGWASLCSRTKTIDKASEDFMELGEGVAPTPGSERMDTLFTPSASGMVLAVAGLAIVAVVFTLWRRSRN